MSNQLQIKNKGESEIQMPNPLIFSPQSFSKLEKRLLYLSLKQLKGRQDPLMQLELFNSDELAEITLTPTPATLGVRWSEERTVCIPYKTVSKYGDWNSFKVAAKKLTGSKLEFRYKNSNGKSVEDDIIFIERARTEEGKGVMIQYTENGLNILTHLSKSYSKFPLEIILQLNSKYSQRLYEILISKCYGTFGGKWKVSLDEFRKLLGIEKGSSYYHWGSLERTTLKNVQKEFENLDNQDSPAIPLRFSYNSIKSGNKVVEIEFNIWVVSEYNQTRILDSLSSKEQAVLEELVKMNVAEKYRMVIIKNHMQSFFKWNYTRKASVDKIKNPAGHLLKTLGLV